MGWSLNIGRIAGTEIRVHITFLLFLIWIFAASYASGGADAAWSSVVFILLVFTCVVAHEFGHIFTARAFGVQTPDVTLLPIGGVARLERIPEDPWQEFLIAIAGPLVNVAIALVLMAFAGATIGSGMAVEDGKVSLVDRLAATNLFLALFNMIPAFPMDGGRILRALLWKMRGDRFGATKNAALVGRGFGYLLIGLGVVVAFQTGSVFSGIWLALIGWFLSNAAESTVAQMSVSRTLSGVRVREVMDAEPPSVGPNVTVAQLVHEHMLHGEHRSFLVRHSDGGLAGIVSLSDVRRTPRDNWEAARVTDIMTRYADLATVGPEDDVEDAMQLLQTREVNQLPVVLEGRSVVGMLTRAGVLRLIDTRLKLGV
jgi:Zn-dependent protease/CBS domain-containing protein